MINQEQYYAESTVTPHKHFRLRIGKVIVGFMQERTDGKTFFSKDNLWWSKDQIVYDSKDRSTELLDANRQMIFEYDIVKIKKYKDEDYTKRGWVIWNASDNALVIKAFEENTVFRLNTASHQAPFRDDLKVISQLINISEL